jgi:hypothetical protein
MTVDDRTRLNLHRKLEAVLGQQEADTLMAHLPPVTWHEVVTKEDIAALGMALRSEMHVMGTELRSEMHAIETNLRAEMQAIETNLRAEVQVMGTNLRSEMQTGFATLRTEFVEGVDRQIKWLVTFAAAWTTVLVAVVRLVP